MLNLFAAVALQACTIVVAADAPNPQAIYDHEIAHCWGWMHEHREKPELNKTYRAAMPPMSIRAKGQYPADHLTVLSHRSKDVRKLCNGNPYGCQWFD